MKAWCVKYGNLGYAVDGGHTANINYAKVFRSQASAADFAEDGEHVVRVEVNIKEIKA